MFSASASHKCPVQFAAQPANDSDSKASYFSIPVQCDEVPTTFKHLLYVSKVDGYHVDCGHWDYAGWPMWITCETKCLAVSWLASDVFEGKVGGDYGAWLKSAKVNWKECDRQLPAVLLQAGDSVWMPFGFVPLPVALDPDAQLQVGKVPKSAQAEEQAAYGTFSVLPVFDGRDFGRHTRTLLGQIEAHIVRHDASIHKAIKDRPDYGVWRSALQEALKSGGRVSAEGKLVEEEPSGGKDGVDGKE